MFPTFRAGDTLKVHVNIIEGKNSRVQVFQGFVLGRHGDGLRETFTVRKVSFGVGVERTFPVHSPIIDKIEVVSKGDVRRAKLYYMRDLRGKAAKIKEKRDFQHRKVSLPDFHRGSMDRIRPAPEPSATAPQDTDHGPDKTPAQETGLAFCVAGAGPCRGRSAA